MATVNLTKENFEEEVTKNDITIIYFWAPWCRPCKAFAPTYEQVSEQHSDLVFAKVNTEDEQELGGHFNIRSIPTLMVIRDSIVIFSQAGALPKSGLEEVIKQVKAVDMEEVRQAIAKEQSTS
ncbi:MAG: thioredoxin family protein [Ghiorsea sp.]